MNLRVADFTAKSLQQWRQRRDELFAEHGLDIEEVYARGDFSTLPPECLMAVCYIDAYNCVMAVVHE